VVYHERAPAPGRARGGAAPRRRREGYRRHEDDRQGDGARDYGGGDTRAGVARYGTLRPARDPLGPARVTDDVLEPGEVFHVLDVLDVLQMLDVLDVLVFEVLGVLKVPQVFGVRDVLGVLGCL
jgi:hypothetical protein